MMAGSSVSGLKKRRKPALPSASISEATSSAEAQSMHGLDEHLEPPHKLPNLSINHQSSYVAPSGGPRSGHGHAETHGPPHHSSSLHSAIIEQRPTTSHLPRKPSQITFASATSLLGADPILSRPQPWHSFQEQPPSTLTEFKRQNPPLKPPRFPLRLLLSDWIQHEGVLSAFALIGIKSLYPWQAAAIECGESGENLIYCAPTSGGKSLVAEILLIRQIMRRLKPQGKAVRRAFGKLIVPEPVRALLVLPFVSIVSEKTRHLEMILKPLGLVVRGYAGGLSDQYRSPLSSKDECLAICTIEKANAAINRLVKEGRVHELACIVVDEAHMVSDPQRGLPLELSLTKIVHASKRFRAQLDQARGDESLPCPPQMVCMSATMGGLESMGNWLDAHVFKTNFRPVVLSEHAVFNRRLFAKSSQLTVGKEANYSPLVESGSLPEYDGEDDAVAECLADGMVMLVAEVMAVGHSCLVFCAGRSACRSSASLLSSCLSKVTAWLIQKKVALPPPSAEEDNERMTIKRKSLVVDLSNASGGKANENLATLMLEGVAYHHAGLTTQERFIVERGFREGSLLVLCCTSTLAAGINLPARRVILRTLWQGAGPVSRSTYLQMIGRAGRAGQSAIGEAFIIGKGQPPEFKVTGDDGEVKMVKKGGGDWEAICKLMNEPMPILRSRLLRSSIDPQAAVNESSVGRNESSVDRNKSLVDRKAADGVKSKIITRGLAPSHVSNRSASAGSNRKPSGQQEVNSAPLFPDLDSKEELAFQQLMLEGVANSSATTDSCIRDLLSSTLLSHQLGHQFLERAAKRALSKLRAMGLILPREGLIPPGHSHNSDLSSHNEMLRYWETTPMGTGVYASSLPIGQGMELYQRLDKARLTLVLSTPLHAILISLMEQPLEINGWGAWEQLFHSLPDGAKSVCELEGVTGGYITRMRSGGKVDKELARQHGRIAGAWLLHLSFDRESHEVEEAWGLPKTLTDKGFPSGEIQKLQKELANWAGMAAVVCSSAGWWHLETVMSNLAQQAAAGVRSELLPLMQIPLMTGARARALFAAGIASPQDLALSDEEAVKEAVESSLPGPPRPSGSNHQAGLVNQCEQSKVPRYLKADPAYLTRAAKSLILSAREHVVDEAQRVALAACLQENSGNGNRNVGEESGYDKLEEETAAIADELVISLLPSSSLALMDKLASPSSIRQPLASASLRGRAKITEISSNTDSEVLKDLLKEMTEQKTIALGVSRSNKASQDSSSALGRAFFDNIDAPLPDDPNSRHSSLSPAMKLPEIPKAAIWSCDDLMETSGSLDAQPTAESEGLAIAWRHNECLFFHLLPLDISDRHEAYLEQVWSAVSLALQDPLISKCIFGLRDSLFSLLSLQSQGSMNQPPIQISGSILDPQLMSWCLNPLDHKDLSLKHILQAILPHYAIQVPAVRDPSVTWGCRQALAAFSLARPLLLMLFTSSQGSDVNPLAVYEEVEVALSIAMAHSAMDKCSLDPHRLAAFTEWLQMRIKEIDKCAGLLLGAEKIDLSIEPLLHWICHHLGLSLTQEPIYPEHVWTPDPLFDRSLIQTQGFMKWRPIKGLREADCARAGLMSALIEERSGLSALLLRTSRLYASGGGLDLIPCISPDGLLTTSGCDMDLIFPSSIDHMAFHSLSLLLNLQHTRTLEQRLHSQDRDLLDAWNGSQVVFVMPFNDGQSEGIFHGILSSVSASESNIGQSISSSTCSIWAVSDPTGVDNKEGRLRLVKAPSNCTWLLMEDACGPEALSSSVTQYIDANGPKQPALIALTLKLSPIDYAPQPMITLLFPTLFLSGLAYHSNDLILTSALDRNHDPWEVIMDHWWVNSSNCNFLHALLNKESNGRCGHQINPRDLARIMVDSIARGDGPKNLTLRLSKSVNTVAASRGAEYLNGRPLWSCTREEATSLMSSFFKAFPSVAKHRADLVSSFLQGKPIESLFGRPLCLPSKKYSSSSSIQARIGRELQSAQVMLFACEVSRAATISTLRSYNHDLRLLWCHGGGVGLRVSSREKGCDIVKSIGDVLSPQAVFKSLYKMRPKTVTSRLVSINYDIKLKI